VWLRCKAAIGMLSNARWSTMKKARRRRRRQRGAAEVMVAVRSG
jgi:hypothetical protein